MTSYPPTTSLYPAPPEDSPISDDYWDKFAANLEARRSEWTSFFRHCLPNAGKDFNVGTTGSGVLWADPQTVAHLVYRECVKFYGRDPLGLVR